MIVHRVGGGFGVEPRIQVEIDEELCPWSADAPRKNKVALVGTWERPSTWRVNGRYKKACNAQGDEKRNRLD